MYADTIAKCTLFLINRSLSASYYLFSIALWALSVIPFSCTDKHAVALAEENFIAIQRLWMMTLIPDTLYHAFLKWHAEINKLKTEGVCVNAAWRIFVVSNILTTNQSEDFYNKAPYNGGL